MRILSFLPSATEMVCALGLADQLVGVSHECDFPAAARLKPAVVRSALDLEKLSLAEIDRSVSAHLRDGQSLYRVDEALVRSLEPDLILTQNLCQVCAPSGNEVTRLLASLSKKPQVLYLTPHSLADVDDNLREVGRAAGRLKQAEELIAAGRARREAVRSKTEHLPRPRVFCIEWIDPVYNSGHWVPEMVDMAGGTDALARRGGYSTRMAWEDVLKWDPEVLVVNPCGFKLAAAIEQTARLTMRAGWEKLAAVREGNVFAVDANSYFARPGPRLTDGVELLAHLIHPEIFNWNGPADALHRMPTEDTQKVR